MSLAAAVRYSAGSALLSSTLPFSALDSVGDYLVCVRSVFERPTDPVL
jgi:hypothetical protein